MPQASQENHNTLPFFEIDRFERLHGSGKLIAKFDVTFAGVVVRKCSLILGKRGLRIEGPGRRTKFAPDNWEAHANFDDDVRAAILEAVEQRLLGLEEPLLASEIGD